MKKYKPLLIFFLILWSSASFAGEADVVEVNVNENSKNSYSFTVAVLHEDTGWKHYANKWEVVDEEGTIFGTRILHHPHVDEQPFTRSLSGVEMPEYIKTVTIRAHDSVHEYGGKTISVELR